MRPITSTITWARAHERHLSALSLVCGFIFDNYAFGRIDRPMTQAVFIAYLLAAGGAIAVLHLLESRGPDRKPGDRTRTILVSAAQFALGCLLSGFCVFYIRSAAIGASWPFLLFMAAILIGNEAFRHYHSRLVFSALLFFFALYSYAILLVPVVWARIGTVPFLLSGAIAVAVFLLYLQVLAWLGHDRFRLARAQIAAGMAVVTLLFNAFYFTKVFPPLPLVLSAAGVYHDVRRVGRQYQVTGEDEPARWRALFGVYPTLHVAPGERLYVYSAVFAPFRLTTRVAQRWEWQDPRTDDWTTQQTVDFTIHGGRTEGYRVYSYRTQPQAGQWRVNIITGDGRPIGRVRFSVDRVAKPPPLGTKILK